MHLTLIFFTIVDRNIGKALKTADVRSWIELIENIFWGSHLKHNWKKVEKYESVNLKVFQFYF